MDLWSRLPHGLVHPLPGCEATRSPLAGLPDEPVVAAQIAVAVTELEAGYLADAPPPVASLPAVAALMATRGAARTTAALLVSAWFSLRPSGADWSPRPPWLLTSRVARDLAAVAGVPDRWERAHLRWLVQLLSLDDASAEPVLWDEERQAALRLLNGGVEAWEGWDDAVFGDVLALACTLVPQDADARALLDRLRLALAARRDPWLGDVLDVEAWAEGVRSFVADQPDPARWVAALRHAGVGGARAAPTARWLRQGAACVGEIGVPRFCDAVQRWADAAPMGAGHGVAEAIARGLRARNADLLRGLLWMWASADPTVGPRLGQLAARWLRKIPGVGAGARKPGHGAIVALGLLPGLTGVPVLSRLAGQLRDAEGRRQVEVALVGAAERAGLARADVEEVALGDGGLGVDGALTVEVGGAHATLSVEDGRHVVVSWPSGRAPSADVRAADPDGVRDVADTARELDGALAGVRHRLERAWIEGRSWTYDAWRARWLEHPLAGQVARRQIWWVGGAAVLWWDGAARTCAGAAVRPAPDAPVRLWHPVEASDGEVEAWRERLLALDLVQPVRQAWRERYALTDAERATGDHSHRFAGHLLRQHVLGALTRERGWTYRLQGCFDGHNAPSLTFEHAGEPWTAVASLTVGDRRREATEAGVFTWVTSDRVELQRAGASVPLDRVPPVVWSEVLRDVDLFTSVASVGLDPSWVPGAAPELDAAWAVQALATEVGERARARRDLLVRLLPRFRLLDGVTIDGAWVIVPGRLHTYRIHLGSGAAMTTTGRHLCIHAVRDADPLRLPFDGDATLSLILAKIRLFKEDDRIKDPTIRAQLRL